MDAAKAFTITLPLPLVMICDRTEPVLPAARLRLFVPSVILPLVNINVPLIAVFPFNITPPLPFIVTLVVVNAGMD